MQWQDLTSWWMHQTGGVERFTIQLRRRTVGNFGREAEEVRYPSTERRTMRRLSR